MKTHFIMLELTNFDFVRRVKNIVFRNLQFINREKCLSQEMNWFCEETPHITILGNLPDISNNETYRKVKYEDEELFKAFSKEVRKGVSFPELIVDTFKNEDAIVVKINCTNCSLYNSLLQLHEQLKKVLPNEENYPKYQPHITITYLNPDTPDTEVNRLCKEFSYSLPKFYYVDGLLLSDSDRKTDTINLFPKFGGF